MTARLEAFSWRLAVIILAIAAVLWGQVCFTYAPLMQDIFKTAAFSLLKWAEIMGFAAIMVVWMYVENTWARRIP